MSISPVNVRLMWGLDIITTKQEAKEHTPA
jgi:hypothetical protein